MWVIKTDNIVTVEFNTTINIVFVILEERNGI